MSDLDVETNKKGVQYLLINKDGEEEIKSSAEYTYDENLVDKYYIDGYTYSLSYAFESASYRVDVETPEGNNKSFEIAMDGITIYDVKCFLRLDDERILIPTFTDDGNVYFVYDTRTNKIKDDTQAYGWLDEDFNKITSVFYNGNAGYADENGIYLIDAINKSVKEVFNRNYCDHSCPDINRTRVVKVDTSAISLVDIKTGDDSGYLIETAFIYIFEKADQNPNAGKNVVELALGYDEVPDAIVQAVCDYNASKDNTCYILMTDRYIPDDSEMYKSQNDEMAYLKQQADISNQMAVDIMNGNGPDMFISSNPFCQIDNGQCLADISDIANALPDEQYFTNVLHVSTDTTAVYQLPLSFKVTGVQVSSQERISQDGFTLKEWPSFVDDYCNGIDPLYMSRAEYFLMLYANMNEKFDNVDAFTSDNKDLHELADYCRNSVSQKGMTAEEYYNGKLGSENNAVFSVMSGIYDYYGALPLNGEASFIGLPSTDGRGPAFILSDTIAISADSKYTDECKGFIRFLLTEKYQKILAGCGGNVLNRSAFENSCKEYQKYYNQNSNRHIERTLRDCDIDDYQRIIDKTSHVFEINNQTMYIVYEEMQAYFCDQKQYDAVVAIIADRVRKASDESK